MNPMDSRQGKAKTAAIAVGTIAKMCSAAISAKTRFHASFQA
jgi:hypothetical protein